MLHEKDENVQEGKRKESNALKEWLREKAVLQ